jgi:carbamoyl-phosphate synthase small subunit
MGLANGAKTAKLKYGHRGPNQPVKDLEKDRIFITSQNHGYYIIEESIDKEKAEVSFININDGTVEGLRYKNANIFTVQFHPETGPQDTGYIIDEFIDNIRRK